MLHWAYLIARVVIVAIRLTVRCHQRKRRKAMSKAKPRFFRNNPALPPAVPNLFEVLVVGHCEGANFVNTFFYADGGAALAPTTEASVANGWWSAFGTAYRAAISADATVDYVKAQCLTSPQRIPFTAIQGFAGTGPAGHEPMTVTATLIRRSGVKGQAGRGRISVPAVPTAWVTGSEVTSAGAYNTLAADLATGFTQAGVTYVAQVVSKKNKNGPVLGASPVLTASADLVLGSARRRKINR